MILLPKVSLLFLTVSPTFVRPFNQCFRALHRHEISLHATNKFRKVERRVDRIINFDNTALKVLAGIALSTTLTFSSLVPISNGMEYQDTVSAIVKKIDTSAGNRQQTFDTFEEVGKIITEGKGVGGDVNYQGIQLDRGSIADEDTAIYNPGLTLLTETEKNTLTDAILRSRKTSLEKKTWTEDNQLAFDFLKQKLDPLHMVELKGYLNILPFYSAIVYLAVLGVQQNAGRGVFEVAYFLGVFLVSAPIVALLLIGT